MRPYSEASVAATVPLSTVPPPLSDAVIPPVAQPKTSSPYHIRSGLILTRPPLLTREQTPFESAFYLYQKRLNERLSAPFRRAFYFRQDTAADLDWRLKHQEREGVAGRDIGRYKSRGRLSWNDELLIGSATSDPAQVVEKLVQDAEMRVSEDGEVIAPEDRVKLERPRPRRTEADENGDVRRLDRALDQTLYLVVRRGKGESATWGFPTGAVKTDEALHEVSCVPDSRTLKSLQCVWTWSDRATTTDRRKSARGISRRQHEHLDRRTPSSGSLLDQACL